VNDAPVVIAAARPKRAAAAPVSAPVERGEVQGNQSTNLEQKSDNLAEVDSDPEIALGVLAKDGRVVHRVLTGRVQLGRDYQDDQT
jgi:hypothetical protein